MCWRSHASSAGLTRQCRQMVVIVYVIGSMGRERISKQAFGTNAMEWAQNNIDNCIRYNGVRCLDIMRIGLSSSFQGTMFYIP